MTRTQTLRSVSRSQIKMNQIVPKLVSERKEGKNENDEFPSVQKESFEKSKKEFEGSEGKNKSSEGEIPSEKLFSQRKPRIKLPDSDSEEEGPPNLAKRMCKLMRIVNN